MSQVYSFHPEFFWGFPLAFSWFSSCGQPWSQRLDTLFSPDKLLLMSSLSLDTGVISAAPCWHFWLLASWLIFGHLFFENFFSWHFLFSTPHSLDTASDWHQCSCFLLFRTSILRPLSVNDFSFDTFCLGTPFAAFHSHISFFCEFSCLADKIHRMITRFVQRPSFTKK